MLRRVDDRNGDLRVIGKADFGTPDPPGADGLDGEAVGEDGVVPYLVQVTIREHERRR